MLYASLYDPPCRPSVLPGKNYEETRFYAGVTRGTLIRLLRLKATGNIADLVLYDHNMETEVVITSFNDIYNTPEGFRARIVGMTLTNRIFNIQPWMGHRFPSNESELWEYMVQRDSDNATACFHRVFGVHTDAVGEKLLVECVNPASALYRRRRVTKDPSKKEILEALSSPALEQDSLNSVVAFGRETTTATQKFFNILHRAGFSYPYPDRSDKVESIEDFNVMGDVLVSPGRVIMLKGDYVGPGEYFYLSRGY